MTRIHHPLRVASILAQARVSDDIQRFHPEQFPAEVRDLITLTKSLGQRVVAVYWPTGEYAVMPCEPHSDMPSPERVISAYYGCIQVARRDQEGQ